MTVIWHPGLRINRVLRVMLHKRWSGETWPLGAPRVSIVGALLIALVTLPNPSQAAPHCQEHEIRLDGKAPPSLGQNPGDADLIHAVASLIQNKLGLPMPAWRKAYFCVSEAAFVEGLLRNVGVRSVAASGSVSRSVGIATRVGVFFRGDNLARMQLVDRVAVVAHELAHLSQHKLAGSSRAELPVWITEGHAEWVASQVLDLLGLRTYGDSRDRVVSSVASATARIKLFPDLSALTMHTSWNRFSYTATHGQAFLAVDWLIEHYGGEKFVEYLSVTGAPVDQWGKVFPVTYGEFVEAFGVHLRDAVPTHRVEDVGETVELQQ